MNLIEMRLLSVIRYGGFSNTDKYDLWTFLKTLFSEMERLQGAHSRLQHKIAEYLARKKVR